MPVHTAFPVALIDISAGEIAVAHALVKKQKEKKPYPSIIAEQVREVTTPTSRSIERLIDETKKTLSDALAALQKSDGHQPTFVLITLSAPWVISQTRHIEYRKKSPFVCTKKLIDELIEKEIAYVEAHELTSFGAFGKDGKIIEKQISHISLNGYATKDPFGKKTDSLTLSLTLTITPKLILDQFLEIVRRIYGTRSIGFTSRLFSTYVFLRDYYQLSSDAWLIDFGNEMTDIAFLKDTAIVSHQSFPLGSSLLQKKIAEGQGVSESEAKTLIETYRLGKINTPHEEKISTSIAAFTESWLASVRTLFDQDAHSYCAPEKCFILGDERFAKIIPDALRNDVFLQHICSGTSAAPLYLTPSEITQTLSFSSESQSTKLLIASLFVERIV